MFSQGDDGKAGQPLLLSPPVRHISSTFTRWLGGWLVLLQRWQNTILECRSHYTFTRYSLPPYNHLLLQQLTTHSSTSFRGGRWVTFLLHLLNVVGELPLVKAPPFMLLLLSDSCCHCHWCCCSFPVSAVIQHNYWNRPASPLLSTLTLLVVLLPVAQLLVVGRSFPPRRRIYQL